MWFGCVSMCVCVCGGGGGGGEGRVHAVRTDAISGLTL